jgi:hypothetical protein
VRDREAINGPPPWRPALGSPRAASSPDAALLRLQRAAGNRAVSRLLARTPGDKDDPGFSRDPNEAQKIGSAGEREEVGRVRRELFRKGYGVVYDRDDIRVMKRNIAAGRANRPPRVDEWLVEAFPDGRVQPELIGIDHARKRILILDLTASPSTSATAKPGDVRKLPGDVSRADEGIPHLEKTKGYGEQAARRKPPWYRDYEVVAQDRYWTTGKYSVEVQIKAKPASTKWDPAAGPPPNKMTKGPNFQPQPHNPDRAAPPVAGGTAARRVIVLDGNVFDQINRGNKAMADKLLELVRANDVYIARSAFEEAVTNRAIPRLGKATELAIKELGIKVTPAGSARTLADVEARNRTAPGKTVLSAADARVAADAKGVGGEVWSVDRGFRSNAAAVRKVLDVKVAPESETVAILEKQAGATLPEQDFRVGRRLLGLPEVEISIGGKVTPRPAAPVAPPPAPVEAPPVEAPPVAGRRIPSGVKVGLGWGLQIALFVFFWWLGSKRAKEQEKLLKELQSKKIDPAVDEALTKQANEGWLVHDAAPKVPMYANVTIAFKNEWDSSGAGDNRSGEGITDASFVSLSFGYIPVQSESADSKDCETTSGLTAQSHCTQITHVTSALLVFHPDHEEYKRQQYEAWEGWVKKHPEWRIKPSAGEGWKKSYWVSQRHAIEDWLKDVARRQLEDELGLGRKKREEPRITVVR